MFLAHSFYAFQQIKESIIEQWEEEIVMGFQDVAYLHTRASFFTIFLKKIAVQVKASGPTTMVGGKQGHAPCTYAPTKPLFVAAEFHRDHKTVIKLR